MAVIRRQLPLKWGRANGIDSGQWLTAAVITESSVLEGVEAIAG